MSRIAGTTSGYSGDGGPAINAQLDGPTALAADPPGNVYIAEGGGHVRKVSTGGIITTIAGNGICHGGCYNSGNGDGGPALQAPLFYPWQIAADAAGNVYIGEWNTPRIRRISTDGIITTVVGTGRSGYTGDGGPATDALTGAAWGLTFDSAGNLYFSDDIPGDDYAPDAVHVRKVSPDGIITTVAGNGAPGESPDAGDGGPATSAQFRVASGIAVDKAGNVYISDFARIRKVSPDGTIATFAGTGQTGFSGDGASAVNAQFNGTYYGPPLATDAKGNLYLADTANNRIRKISADGTITRIAGNGNDCCYSGDGGPALAAQFYVPTGIAAGSDGTIYISDTFNNRIRRIDAAGIITTIAGTGADIGPTGDGGPAVSARLAWPTGIKLDHSGNVYIADAGYMRVRRIAPDGTITTAAGNGSAGLSGDGGAATSASLNWPKDVAFDAQGNFFIADTANNAIRRVSPDGLITTVARGFNQPSGLAFDDSGILYAADTNNFRIVKIMSDGSIIAVAGNGTKGYSGDGGPGTNAQLLNPTGITFDHAGNLYIGDGASVRMLSPAGIITTIAGNGLIGFSGDGGPATSAETGVWGLALDSTGKLYLADPFNNAIRVLK
jgi:sugar lactone lactonase YvrE